MYLSRESSRTPTQGCPRPSRPKHFEAHPARPAAAAAADVPVLRPRRDAVDRVVVRDEAVREREHAIAHVEGLRRRESWAAGEIPSS